MSGYRRLFIWVEGTDDERFFEWVVKPHLEARYDQVVVRPYAAQTPDKVGNFLHSIKSMQSEYIFVADIDNSPCVTTKKELLLARYKNLDADRIIVVKAEIESWYRAGLDHAACARFALRPLADTERVTKEQFQAMRPAEFRSGIDYMIEMLKYYQLESACAQNRSFGYFAKKYGLI